MSNASDGYYAFRYKLYQRITREFCGTKQNILIFFLMSSNYADGNRKKYVPGTDEYRSIRKGELVTSLNHIAETIHADRKTVSKHLHGIIKANLIWLEIRISPTRKINGGIYVKVNEEAAMAWGRQEKDGGMGKNSTTPSVKSSLGDGENFPRPSVNSSATMGKIYTHNKIRKEKKEENPDQSALPPERGADMAETRHAAGGKVVDGLVGDIKWGKWFILKAKIETRCTNYDQSLDTVACLIQADGDLDKLEKLIGKRKFELSDTATKKAQELLQSEEGQAGGVIGNLLKERIGK